jgi:hypothetical protein
VLLAFSIAVSDSKLVPARPFLPPMIPNVSFALPVSFFVQGQLFEFAPRRKGQDLLSSSWCQTLHFYLIEANLISVINVPNTASLLD